MEDITEGNYKHTKRVCKDFKIKNLGKYHDLYVQSDTLLLTDVFNNYRNMCLNIFEPDPKLDLLTDIDVLLMVEKGIRRGIYHAIYRYVKVNDKYMKDYD